MYGTSSWTVFKNVHYSLTGSYNHSFFKWQESQLWQVRKVIGFVRYAHLTNYNFEIFATSNTKETSGSFYDECQILRLNTSKYTVWHLFMFLFITVCLIKFTIVSFKKNSFTLNDKSCPISFIIICVKIVIS